MWFVPTVAILAGTFLLLASPASTQCNTNQNPYCRGNARFEQLCCTYPNICYWSNRNGDPACCQAGTDCRADGGPAPSQFTAVQATTYYAQTTYSSTVPQQQSTSTYYSSSSWTSWTTTTSPQLTSLSTVTTPGVVVVTGTYQVVTSVAVTSTPPGTFATFSQAQYVAQAANDHASRAFSATFAFIVTLLSAVAFLVH